MNVIRCALDGFFASVDAGRAISATALGGLRDKHPERRLFFSYTYAEKESQNGRLREIELLDWM